MTFHIAESWTKGFLRYTDPDCFLMCDSPTCDRPWLTGDALVCWALSDDRGWSGLFTDRVLLACDETCLAAAQDAMRKRAAWEDRPRPYWSTPQSVESWLEALRDSITRDPDTTPIGEFVPAIS